jgi:hypothetical protein
MRDHRTGIVFSVVILVCVAVVAIVIYVIWHAAHYGPGLWA